MVRIQGWLEMLFQYHPYSIILTISSLTTLIVSVIVWRRTTAPGSATLGVMLFAMFIWGFAYTLVWSLVQFEHKVFWLKVMYFGVEAIPTLFLVFTLQITHREMWLNFRNIILFSIEPILVIFIVWTSPRFIFTDIELVLNNGLATLHVHRGIGFLINSYYSYALVLLSFYILWVSSRHAKSFFKKQYQLILYGSIIPLVLSIYTQTRFVALSDLDLAPVSFGISGVIYAYAIFRHQFMELIPVARGQLIENMSDGVLVIDEQGRIIDINPAMQNFLDNVPDFYIGRNVSEALNMWTENTDTLMSDLDTHTELNHSGNPSRYMDLRVTPLYDDDHLLNGRLIVFRDFTERKQVEKDLRYAMDRMQTQLIEIGLLQSQLREQAVRDALTNLFNRRYLEETLERELARAARELYPLCIVMMDIDHFKDVNDTHGHEAGDLVLQKLAEMVTKQSRHGDFVCRFGGEEFVLVMPNIGIEVARERALSLHKIIRSLNVPYEHSNLTITVSMGLALYPAHGDTKEDLLRAADRALYAAKRAGRDQISVYSGWETKEE
jgi:diguanylate cyclase (GGDEF)-like protein/PAS domain S-box-containing protein